MSMTSDPSDDDILAAARAGFVDEAAEMLRQFEEALLGMETSPDDEDILNSAFRAAHTIKGTAGLFGCDRVVAFTHDVETLLEAVRSGHFNLTEEAMGLLLQSRDQIEALLGDVESTHGDPDIQARSKKLSGSLQALLGADAAASGHGDTPADEDQPAVSGKGVWHIQARFGTDALRNGLDPVSFLRYLGTQGSLTQTGLLADMVPPLAELDPEDCHLGFDTLYETEADKATIERAFEFAIDDCSLLIEARHAPPQAVATPTGTLPALVPEAASQPVPDGEARVAQPSERRSGRGDRRSGSRDRRGDDARFVRVQADKLDHLIDLVGELVIASSGAQLVAQQEGSAIFAEAAQRIRTLVESARDGALSLRMVPIGETFARFHRVVRDVSKLLDKEVDLQITGADTEMDKSMVEIIADPLMHLVRNSLDHGLETAQERTAAGKSARGCIALNAYHEGGQIIIEVTDDGRGLNRERILRKAIERGLVRADQQLSDHEIDQLICAPGFSTAEQVTDISGRGVGMDVVKSSIEALRGQMQLASEWGRGTTTQIRLPLTLAIIDGFLTSVGGTYYVLPMEIVSECIEVPPECRAEPQRGVGYFDLRGEILPYFDLARLHKVEAGAQGRRSLIVARDGQTRIGLIVDRLHGEYQTVIKPLSSLFRHLRAIAGSTILGSGEVALVVDVPALVHYAIQATRSTSHLASTSPARLPNAG